MADDPLKREPLRKPGVIENINTDQYGRAKGRGIRQGIGDAGKAFEAEHRKILAGGSGKPLPSPQDIVGLDRIFNNPDALRQKAEARRAQERPIPLYSQGPVQEADRENPYVRPVNGAEGVLRKGVQYTNQGAEGFDALARRGGTVSSLPSASFAELRAREARAGFREREAGRTASLRNDIQRLRDGKPAQAEADQLNRSRVEAMLQDRFAQLAGSSDATSRAQGLRGLAGVLTESNKNSQAAAAQAGKAQSEAIALAPATPTAMDQLELEKARYAFDEQKAADTDKLIASDVGPDEAPQKQRFVNANFRGDAGQTLDTAAPAAKRAENARLNPLFRAQQALNEGAMSGRGSLAAPENITKDQVTLRDMRLWDNDPNTPNLWDWMTDEEVLQTGSGQRMMLKRLQELLKEDPQAQDVYNLLAPTKKTF